MDLGFLMAITQVHLEYLEKVKALLGREELEFLALLSFPMD